MNAMIKVLVIPSWYPPDGGYFFKEHCEALASGGVHIEVLVNRVISIRRLGRVRLNQLGRFHVSSENGIRVLRSWMFKIPGNEKWNALRWIRSTVRLYNRYWRAFGEPDLILAHSAIWAGCAAYGISRKHKLPYVITEHRSFFVFRTEESRRMLRPFYVPLLKTAYMNSCRMIVVSESMKPGLLELEPGLEGHIQEIPNMVDGDFFTLPSSKRSVVPFTFITAGRLIHTKGLDLLIKALEGLVQKGHTHVRLKILGRGEERAGLENLASDLNLDDRVIFTGRRTREEVRDEFHKASCFILSSRYEAFGVVLIEAMATGLPVIATRSGGPETIITPEYGYLTDTENINGLEGAMEKMMENYTVFDQEKIRENMLQRYGRSAITREYISLFHEICFQAESGG